jgi:hypothetical protein
MKQCKVCGEEFKLQPDHRGYSNVCEDCGGQDVERSGAEIMWTGKHTVELNIVAMSVAEDFNRKNKRMGTSVLRALVPRTPNLVYRESNNTADRGAKEKHANNPGAGYTSKLGERHSTKR